MKKYIVRPGSVAKIGGKRKTGEFSSEKVTKEIQTYIDKKIISEVKDGTTTDK